MALEQNERLSVIKLTRVCLLPLGVLLLSQIGIQANSELHGTGFRY